MSTTKRKPKSVRLPKTTETLHIKPATFTIRVDDKRGLFDVANFVWDIHLAFCHVNPVFKYDRPLTLAELTTAEVEAHNAMTTRVEDGPPEGVPESITADDVGGSVYALDLIGWGTDVSAAAQAWEKIANELLAARAAQPKLKKAA